MRLARITAVGCDFGSPSEYSGRSDRKPLERRLGLVDFGAMNRHQDPSRRKIPGKRRRNEERPIGGMDDIVALGPDKAACEQNLGRKILHRVQSAAEAPDLVGQGAVECPAILGVVRCNHRYIRAERGGGSSDLARIGANPAGGGGELTRKQQNSHAGSSVCR